MFLTPVDTNLVIDVLVITLAALDYSFEDELDFVMMVMVMMMKNECALVVNLLL